ncbi:hypothetical protein [uncultured Winogradskyella sp.]|uniref:hypothetical protein n=1 Tax=uncultured Winogradskyella sp. TaxID=395353 RepID=UPI002615230B|nr:hypothetical protein [uncultured Winogradskyella sp.]
MKKNTFLYILVVFLIIVNGFFLFNYMGNHNDNDSREPERNKGFIVKELGFNASQLEEFNKKSEGHHHRMMGLADEIKELKDKLFSSLSDDTIKQETMDSISSLICEKERAKDKEIFNHFKMIQNIATDKQKEKFKTILMDALRQGDQGNRPPPNGEDGRRPPPRGGSEGHRPPPRKD